MMKKMKVLVVALVVGGVFAPLANQAGMAGDTKTINLAGQMDNHELEADPPPIDWSNLIVSRGGPRTGNQETQTGRDRYEAAPG